MFWLNLTGGYGKEVEMSEGFLFVYLLPFPLTHISIFKHGCFSVMISLNVWGVFVQVNKTLTNKSEAICVSVTKSKTGGGAFNL